MNQTQAKILIVAIILLSVLGLLFLFRKDIQTLLLKEKNIPSSQRVVKNTKEQNVLATDDKYKIDAGSTFPNYEFTIKNKDRIVVKLLEAGIFGSKYLHWGKQTTGETPLSIINIYIISKSDGTPYVYNQESYVTLFNGNILVFLISDENSLSQNGIENKLLKTFVATVYKVRYPQVENEKVEEFTDNFIKDLNTEDYQYFQIKKK